jgi:hypothetical protein
LIHLSQHRILANSQDMVMIAVGIDSLVVDHHTTLDDA